MSDESEFQMPTPDPALRKLDFLVGQWRLTGTTVEGPTGPAAELSGVETFEWMEGGFFLVHHWKGAFDMAGESMIDTGYEFYDYNPATQKYRAHFFNNLGPYDEAGSKYEGEFDGSALVVIGPARITRKLNNDGSITYDGDLPGEEGKGWTPWMQARLTKVWR